MLTLASTSRVLNHGNPTNRACPLTRSLAARYLALPGGGKGASVFDISGKAQHGTLANGASWNSSRGRPGGWGSLSFDGSNDVVNLTIMTPTGSAWTVAAWINSGSTGAIAHLISNDNGSTAGSRIWQFRLDASGVLRVIAFTAGATNASAVGTTDLRSTGWRHVAGTWDGSNVRCFVDGVEEGNAVLSGTLTNVATDAVTIGDGVAGHNSGSGPFSGLIDDAFISYRCLSAGEIINLRQDSFGRYATLNWMPSMMLLESVAAPPSGFRSRIAGGFVAA